MENPVMAAVFIDLDNLTGGTGNDAIEFAGLPFGDVTPGTFKLKTVLDAIDQYAAELVPKPVKEKWAVDSLPRSRAVPILDLNRYHVVHIDQRLSEKERREPYSDVDVTLMSKLAEVTSDHPAITHVVLVTGDEDFIAGVELQISRGKSVHILTRRASVASGLLRLANQYSQECRIVYLEDLMAKHHHDLPA